MNGLLGNLRRGMPSTESMAGARGAFDALPQIMDALKDLPAMLKELPPASVMLGAASRLLSDAITKELVRRGPSEQFLAACAEAGLEPAAAGTLHDALVEEISR